MSPVVLTASDDWSAQWVALQQFSSGGGGGVCVLVGAQWHSIQQQEDECKWPPFKLKYYIIGTCVLQQHCFHSTSCRSPKKEGLAAAAAACEMCFLPLASLCDSNAYLWCYLRMTFLPDHCTTKHQSTRHRDTVEHTSAPKWASRESAPATVDMPFKWQVVTRCNRDPSCKKLSTSPSFVKSTRSTLFSHFFLLFLLTSLGSESSVI